ncbi:MAG: TrbC/VirB2 family protein [Phenylobacterium sp.]|uniref:TrbC/VirB2 family protein n=1 Tax=Phenylobacterium sp. TaxID=1871053 RepID=UPI001A235A83|nr:TrbC/VirB2 family protein [Phenylobacterium sp.]MBJ7410680.1 TrbC/VirB2 family protein [Phenylobacterium sp.]
MTASRRARTLVLLATAATFAAGPAFAQAGGGDLTGFLQNLVDLLNSGVVRLLAVIAVILTGVVWMFGQIDLRRAGTVVIGIIVVFGASTIVDMLTGGGGGV